MDSHLWALRSLVNAIDDLMPDFEKDADKDRLGRAAPRYGADLDALVAKAEAVRDAAKAMRAAYDEGCAAVAAGIDPRACPYVAKGDCRARAWREGHVDATWEAEKAARAAG